MDGTQGGQSGDSGSVVNQLVSPYQAPLRDRDPIAQMVLVAAYLQALIATSEAGSADELMREVAAALPARMSWPSSTFRMGPGRSRTGLHAAARRRQGAG
jgi:hypothetical protein